MKPGGIFIREADQLRPFGGKPESRVVSPDMPARKYGGPKPQLDFDAVVFMKIFE